MRAMILLGINCGYGNHDCAALTFKALDLDGLWIRYSRHKTGVPRKSPLWPETAAAIRDAIKKRPKPDDSQYDNLVFISQLRTPYVVDHFCGIITDGFSAIAKRLNIHTRGKTFYALRHTFETVAGESKDQVAVNAIMGHVDSTMAGAYRERISDERLRAVADFVHAWLFKEQEGKRQS